MKTLKPQKLGILTRCFEFKRRCYFGVSVLAFIPLGGRDDLFSEVSMWKFAASELGADAALDVAIPKAKAEFLVTGSAFVPGGEPRPGCAVRVRLGGREKTLHVSGDRYWKGEFPSDPVPFVSMPLDWAHAFGGEGYAANPVGRGFATDMVNTVAVRRLPNIDYPNQRVTSPEQCPDLAGFGPLDFSRPQRSAKAGTHDDRWLKEDFPGFARDIDWTIFNLAPPDQWFDGPLRGDEPYRLENLHPSLPLLEGRLPGFTARCFVNRRDGEAEKFEEIPLRLFTVWLFPHAERAILICQGACQVADEDAADILHLIIGAERLDEPKSPEHYREVMRLRLDKEKGCLHALRDADLLPAGLEGVDASLLEDKAMTEGEGLLRKNLYTRAVREVEKARAVIVGYGLDPDLHGPKVPPPEEPLPDLEHLPDFMEKLEADAETQRKDAEEGAARSLREAEKLFTSMGMDFTAIRREISGRPAGPPAFNAREQLSAMEELSERLRVRGIETPEVDEYLADETFRNRLFEGERKLKEAYRITAHHQDPAPAMEEERARSVRRFLQDARAEGRDLSGIDLTGADLSGMDLHGAVFEDAFLESVNFEGADLTDCTFRNAVLAHANLKDARLSNADLEGANLGGAGFTNARVRDVNLRGAILAKADLTGADFTGAQLHETDLSGVVFNDTDFSRVRASSLNFLESDLRGLRLPEAHLEKCTFLKVDVSGVDFSGATLAMVVFLEVQGRASRFRNGDLTKVCFVQQCDFESADFSGACLRSANLRGSRLTGCDFSEARLDGADLSECVLRNARLYRAVARDARFVKADLNGAVLTSMNAMNALFQRADIRGADLRGANLFQADFARVHADSRTLLDNALMKKVRIYPRRIAQPE